MPDMHERATRTLHSRYGIHDSDDDHRLHLRTCRDSRCRDRADGPKQDPLAHPEGLTERRGLAWIIGGFLFCPCHLPLTLWVLGVAFAGTAAGTLLREHALAAGVLVTAVWLVATCHGLRLLRRR